MVSQLRMQGPAAFGKEGLIQNYCKMGVVTGVVGQRSSQGHPG